MVYREAKYKSITTTVQELEWVKSLTYEFGLDIQLPIIIYCDNLGATYLVSNPVYHSNTKHLAIDLHFVREKVEDKTFRIQHIPESQQRANILTKPL